MSTKTSKDLHTNEINTDIHNLADGINNALFGIAGNAELIRLKVSGVGQIDDHVTSILTLTRKIAHFTTQLSASIKSERIRS